VALTNREVRETYLETVSSIPALNREWEAEGAPLKERARRAWEIRHRARIDARASMADQKEVEMLRQRDLAKYGNSDGPTFEQLLNRERDRGQTDEEAYEAILVSSTSTDEPTNRKFAQ